MAIKIPVEDRVSTYPGRIKLTPVSGQNNVYDMSRADEPVTEGTPLNKALLDQKAYILTEDTTVHVSPSGSDAEGDGSSIAPFATIQKALDALPKLLGGHEATISIAAGTYEERIIIEGFSGGKLIIGVSGQAVTIRGINVINSNQVIFNIPTVAWAAGFAGTIVQVGYNSSAILASAMSVQCAGSSEGGIAVTHGGELLSDSVAIDVSDCAATAIRVAYGSRAALAAVTGSRNAYIGLAAESGSTLSYGTSSLTSARGDVATNGGIILTGNGVPVPSKDAVGKAVVVNSTGDGYALEQVQTVFYATLPAGSWNTQGDRFVQTVTVPGIRENDHSDVDVYLNGLTIEQEDAVVDAWGGAMKITLANDSMMFYFNSQPDVAIPIKIKVVR